MFDVWIGDVELTTLFLALCLSLILPGQLLLCLRVRSLALRLLPLCLFAALAAGLAASALAESAQARLGLSVLAIFAALMALACALGWGLWVLTGRKKWRRPD